jgi:hypothetical protein
MSILARRRKRRIRWRSATATRTWTGKRRFDLAKLWAQRAITLLDALPAETVADVAITRQSVGGVPIPDLLHAGVVRERLGDVLI